MIKSYLVWINKKQNLEIDSATSRGGQRKCMTCIDFPWPPRQAELSVFNVRLFVKNGVFEELLKSKEIFIDTES